MIASEGKILFKVVREAIKCAGITLTHSEDLRSLLVWHDTIKDGDYFSTLKPWQVVNRLPNINLICRKAPFVRMIQRIALFEPESYRFLPNSFILPLQKNEFLEEMKKTGADRKKYLVKPDNGSLGSGITIINPNTKVNPNIADNLAVAQEYVESYLIDNKKFDLRVYVLIASISPLKIYVFRNGVARFCSDENGANTVYSQLTNTAVNRKHANGDINTITKMIEDVFNGPMKENGVDINSLWERIDDAIVFTVLSAYQFLLKGQETQCKTIVYSRCFQILGFDVLLDSELNPHILEVNYRPSLDTDTADERLMKLVMLSEAMKIACPLSDVQDMITDNIMLFSESEWRQFLENSPKLKGKINAARAAAEKGSHFVQVYPSKNNIKNRKFLEIIDKVRHMPSDMQTNYRLPCEVKSNCLDRYLANHPKSQQITPKLQKSINTKSNLIKSIHKNNNILNRSENIGNNNINSNNNNNNNDNNNNVEIKRLKAASKLTINKFVNTPSSSSPGGVRSHSSATVEKIVLPQPKQISNTITFSLQIDNDDENNISKEKVLPSLLMAPNGNNMQQTPSKMPFSSKKAIRKPVMKKNVM